MNIRRNDVEVSDQGYWLRAHHAYLQSIVRIANIPSLVVITHEPRPGLVSIVPQSIQRAAKISKGKSSLSRDNPQLKNWHRARLSFRGIHQTLTRQIIQARVLCPTRHDTAPTPSPSEQRKRLRFPWSDRVPRGDLRFSVPFQECCI